jgi:transposase InsO family protein
MVLESGQKIQFDQIGRLSVQRPNRLRAERFFATLETQLLTPRRFQSQAEARMVIFQWLEGWYNPHRRYSALGYL